MNLALNRKTFHLFLLCETPPCGLLVDLTAKPTTWGTTVYTLHRGHLGRTRAKVQRSTQLQTRPLDASAETDPPNPRESRRGGCNKADLNCVDCKTATMKVIGEIYESFILWLQNGVLVKHFLSLEIIKEMNHKLDYKLIFTYFTKTHDNKRVSGEHVCKFMCNKKNWDQYYLI